jgi:hypothetical protein
VNLDVEDIVTTREGIILTLRWSKTHQEGQGTELAIPKGAKTGDLPGNHPRGLAHLWACQAWSSLPAIFVLRANNDALASFAMDLRAIPS